MGIDFLVLTRPKTIDIKGYITFLDGEDKCPEDRAKNIFVEVTKLGGNDGIDEQLPNKKLLLSCQYIYTKLEKGEYLVKVIEKQGKAMTKIISQEVFNLNDDAEISDGVKVHDIKIERNKGNMQENLNQGIFSPTIIVILILAMLQWNYTVSLVEKFLSFFKR